MFAGGFEVSSSPKPPSRCIFNVRPAWHTRSASLWLVFLAFPAFVCGQTSLSEPFLVAPIIEVSTAAGNGQYGEVDGVARGGGLLDTPRGIAASPDGTWLVATDYYSSTVRLLNLSTGTLSTLAGGTGGYAEGAGASAMFQRPLGVAISPDGTWVAVADTANSKIRKIVVATRAVSTLSGSDKGYNDGAATNARFNVPSELAFHPTGQYLLVADNGNSVIRRVDASSGEASTVAGQALTPGMVDGGASSSKVSAPRGIAMSPDGRWAAVADIDYNAIRRLDTVSWNMSTLAGGKTFPDYVNGLGTKARFSSPTGLCISPGGGVMLIIDTDNNVIRRMDMLTMNTSTFAGSGAVSLTDSMLPLQSAFKKPVGCAFGPGGAWVAISDADNHVIRNISASYPVKPTPPPDPYSDFSKVVNVTGAYVSSSTRTGGLDSSRQTLVLLAVAAASLVSLCASSSI